MTDLAATNQSLKTISNLPFELVAIPRNKIKLSDTASDFLHVPVNVKIRIKSTAVKDVQHEIISVSTFKNSKKVRLVSSDQTIMSFDLCMEADQMRKHQKKSQNRFLQLFKAGGCLSIQDDEDVYNYMPGSSCTTNIIQSRCNIVNAQNDKIVENFSLKKNLDLVNAANSTPRPPKGFLGKCKPGGCLDPPFGEDKYIYEPQLKEIELEHEKIRSQIHDISQDDKDVRKKSKDLSKSIIEEIYSNSLITYPTMSSTDFHTQEENQKKKLRNRISSENKERTSVNEFSKTYFIPPRKARSKSDDSDKDGYQGSHDVIDSNRFISNIEEKIGLAHPKKDLMINYASFETNVTTKTEQNDNEIAKRKSIEEHLLQEKTIVSSPNYSTIGTNENVNNEAQKTESSVFTASHENFQPLFKATSLIDSGENGFELSDRNSLNKASTISVKDENTLQEKLNGNLRKKQSKDSICMLGSSARKSKVENLISKNSSVSFCSTNKQLQQSTSPVTNVEPSNIKVTTQEDAQEYKLNSVQYVKEDILKSSIDMNSVHKSATDFQENHIPSNDLKIDQKFSLSNHTVQEQNYNYLNGKNVDMDMVDVENAVSQLKETFENTREIDQNINENELLSNENSQDSVILSSPIVEPNLITRKSFEVIDNYRDKLFDTKDLGNRIRTSLDGNEISTVVDEINSKPDVIPQILRTKSNDFNVGYDKQQKSAHDIRKADQFKINEVAKQLRSNLTSQEDIYSLPLKKSLDLKENLSDKLFEIKDLANKNNKLMDKKASATTEDDAGGTQLAIHKKISINDDNYDKHQKPIDDMKNRPEGKEDQYAISKFEKQMSNNITPDNNIISTDTGNIYKTISILEDNISIKSFLGKKEDSIEYSSKERITTLSVRSTSPTSIQSSADVKIAKESIISARNEGVIKPILEKASFERHQNQKSLEKQTIEMQSDLQLPSKTLGSFITENVKTILNKDNLEKIKDPENAINHFKKSDIYSIHEEREEIIKTENNVSQFDAVTAKENNNITNNNNFEKDSNDSQFPNITSSVAINLGFNSQINNKNEAEISTFNPFIGLEHYPQDNVTVIKSILRKNNEAFRIPVNSKLDLSLKLEPVNNLYKDKDFSEYYENFKSNLVDKSTEVSMPRDDLVQETLNSVYKTLLPVKMIIQDLKHEADLLLQQQGLLKKLLNPTATTPIRLIQTKKNCKCLKKENNYDHS